MSMMIPLSSPGRTCSGPVRVSLVLSLIRNAPNLRGRRTGSFGWDTVDARVLERREAEPVRSSVREGSEALAGDTYEIG